jgi:hypothetical protein
VNRPARIGDLHVVDGWDVHLASLERSERNHYGHSPVVFENDVRLDARGRLAPVISGRIRDVFAAVVYLPQNRTAAAFIAQKKLERDLWQTAIQGRNRQRFYALDCVRLGLIRRWTLRPRAEAKQK